MLPCLRVRPYFDQLKRLKPTLNQIDAKAVEDPHDVGSIVTWHLLFAFYCLVRWVFVPLQQQVKLLLQLSFVVGAEI